MKESRYSVFDDGRVIFRYTDPQTGSPFQVDICCPLPSKLHADQGDIMERHRLWARAFSIPPGEEKFVRYLDNPSRFARVLSMP